MMYQPKLSNTPHGLPAAPSFQSQLRQVRVVRPVAVVSVLGVADADVVPLGAED